MEESPVSAEEVLTAAIKASAPLMAEVKGALYPDYVRLEAGLPGIAYIRGATEYFHTIHTPRAENRPTFEVHLMAETRTDAVRLGAYLEQALIAGGLYVQTRNSAFDADQNIYSTVLTVSVMMQHH